MLVLSSLVPLQKQIGDDTQTIPFTFPLFLSFKFSLCFHHLQVVNMIRHLRLSDSSAAPDHPELQSSAFLLFWLPDHILAQLASIFFCADAKALSTPCFASSKRIRFSCVATQK